MELVEVVSKQFELLQLNSLKSSLVLKIAEHYALDRKWELSGDLSAHVRDQHRGYFDHEYWLKCKQGYDAEMKKLRDRYRKVCEQITSLEAELKAHYDSAGLVA